MKTFLPLVSLLVVAVLAIGGCGDGDDDSTAATTSTSAAPAGPTATTADGSSTTTTVPTSTTTTTVTTSSATSGTNSTGTTLPGTEFDLAPPAGRLLSVVGVAHDDTLNVRALPGTDQTVVERLSPVADDAEASGRARMLTRTIWFEVSTADGETGWVNARYTAHAGPVFDLTADVVAKLGEVPEEETMADLGRLVAETLAPTDADGPARITMTVAPTVGDLGEVTYDLIGLADDATMGLRLHVFGEPAEGGEGFWLRSVESTDLCIPVRGVSSSGLCS